MASSSSVSYADGERAPKLDPQLGEIFKDFFGAYCSGHLSPQEFKKPGNQEVENPRMPERGAVRL